MDTQSIVSKPEYASSEFSAEGPPVSKQFFKYFFGNLKNSKYFF